MNELRAFVLRYVVLPAGAAEILALWILHTYAYRLRRVTTYLGIVSPEKRCGKTTLMTVLSTSKPGAAGVECESTIDFSGNRRIRADVVDR